MNEFRYIAGSSNTSSADLGGKGASLARLDRAGLTTPPWRVVTPAAFYASLPARARIALSRAAGRAQVAEALGLLVIPYDLGHEVSRAVAELCPNGERLAVRSSAVDEDGVQHSFAGQLDSFLFVAPDRVLERIIEVWRSGFSDRVLAYRQENGLPLAPLAPAVILQRMVAADSAGVAFSADPVSGRRAVVVVSAVLGVGSALVSGESDADTFLVGVDDKIEGRTIAHKATAKIAGPDGGTVDAEVPADRAAEPALTDEQVLAVAELARRAQVVFGRPQDIEWVLKDGRIYVVQSRPITSLAALADPDGAPILWDNSNIAESYNGVTTPLTFSFARKAYENVYRQLCRILGVRKSVIEAHDLTFRRMLGLIRGRIYYNLLSWYRLLALLPGYKTNRAFMEQMMGVGEALPPGLMPESPAPTGFEKFADRMRLAASCVRLIAAHATIGASIAAFRKRLDRALAAPYPALDRMRADQLAEYYRGLEGKLLTRWDAPLVNDLFAMVYYGLLRRCVTKWCGDEGGTLQNDLVTGQGGMISAEPARRISAMADLARGQEPLLAALEGDASSVEREIRRFPEFARAYDEYMERFGDRCLEELKLESRTLQDDPSLLLGSIAQLARSEALGRPELGRDARRSAEKKAKAALGFNLFRRAAFGVILSAARKRVRDRENLRFERTRLFGRVRCVFLEIGARLVACNLLDDARDVFYLEVEEALGLIDGTATTVHARELVAVRREEFQSYREKAAPGDRFLTTGMVHQGNRFLAARTSTSDPSRFGEDLRAEPGRGSDSRQGIGCCPGVVRGRVRVITDPRGASMTQGAILVAERTDPGWIMLFPSASGVLVERGSLLSHSAIVARELGIPAVVSVPGITTWLRDGDQVEFDGSSGIVRRLACAEVARDAE